MARSTAEDPGCPVGAADVHTQAAAYGIGYLPSDFKVFIRFNKRLRSKYMIF